MNIRHRVGLPRMSFHVMNRGARKARIFDQDADRRRFMDLLGRFCLKHEVKLSSWCLMSNHYHFEPSSEGTPLVRTMHDLDGCYARYYNESYGGSGCLFQGPFKSMSISNDRGLAYVSRYIHLNPQHVGEDPLEYPWSSCRAFLGLEPTPPWLDPLPVLSQFGSTREEARANYRFYLESAPPRRRTTPCGEDPVEDYLFDYVGHLAQLWEERCRLLGWPPRTQRLDSLVCWYAHRREGIPVKILQEHYGYASPGAVRSIVYRFLQRLAEETDLSEWGARVDIMASPERQQTC